MTRLPAVLISCMSISIISAQEYSQYFDGADTSIYNSVIISIDSTSVWQIGPPQKAIFTMAATAPNVIVTDTINPYPPNDTSRFEFTVHGMYWGIMAIQWKQMLDLEREMDHGLVEFSIDSGLTWQNAFDNPYVYNFYGFAQTNVDTLTSGEIGFTGTDTMWRDIWLCYDMSWVQQFEDSLRVRFTLRSDSMQTGQDGWMIDNMMVHQTIIHTVGEKEQEEYLRIFPNPADDRFTISAKKTDGFHIIESMRLYDASGRIVDQWRSIPTNFFVDTRKYGNGKYQLEVKTNLRSETLQLMIDHD